MIAAVTDSALPGMREAAPPGVEVRRLADGLDGVAFAVPRGGDGAALEALGRHGSLRVVQSLSAGTEWLEPHVPPWATLCSARGARDITVAEWVIGALLGDLYGQLRVARSRTWEEFRPAELHGMTLLVLGHGSIGRALEARLAAFGARVVGVASRARDGVHGVDELPALLPHADAVVVLLPLTPATRGLVDAGVLARMRDGALLVSAGRGAVVDSDALVAELASGRLRAVLDVTDPEPLPPGIRCGSWRSRSRPTMRATPRPPICARSGWRRSSSRATSAAIRWRTSCALLRGDRPSRLRFQVTPANVNGGIEGRVRARPQNVAFHVGAAARATFYSPEQ